MEITPFTMYIFTRLDIFLAVSIIGLIVSAFISAMIFADIKCAQEFNRPKDEALAKKEFKVSVAFVVLFLLCATFIPSKKAAAFIYVVPKVVNNEKIQSIASDGLDAIATLVKASNEYLKALSAPDWDEETPDKSSKSNTPDTGK